MCRERMSVGDVERAFHKLLQVGSASPFPCPVGFWAGELFCLEDGRHEWVAAVMLGKTHILVCWLEGAK